MTEEIRYSLLATFWASFLIALAVGLILSLIAFFDERMDRPKKLKPLKNLDGVFYHPK